MWLDGCPDCCRVWSLYTKASVLHISLFQQQGLAAAHGDVGRCAQLEPRLKAAHQARKAMWQAVVEHERGVHNHELVAA
jgi:DNA polymerase III psi subunit